MVSEVASSKRVDPLARRDRPAFEAGEAQLRVVDLFAGCGGLSLGLAQSSVARGLGLDITLALDAEPAATRVFQTNFPKARVAMAKVEDYFDGRLESSLTTTEREVAKSCGRVDMLIGGPPCQGHSNLNNRTRRDDPKNALYARMARAAAVLRPHVLIIENVPTVQHDRGDVLGITTNCLSNLGYAVGARTIGLHALGVAQKRRRHVLLATLLEDIDPSALLTSLAERPAEPGLHLGWAIGDLAEMNKRSGYDIEPRASAKNLERMDYLIMHDIHDLPNSERPRCQQDNHSYKSMYGRLKWDSPAQTITSGFASIGQGRYMHPSHRRALTAHEAARIQGFPDYYDFSSAMRRGDLATMIGNAVPPALTREIGAGLLDTLGPRLTSS